MQFQACAYCDHPNPAGANFCNHCGAAQHLKSCRRCGSVADPAARRCRACHLEFPQRPTINVDIPWASAGAANADARAEAQRLIEKASGRSLAPHADPELVLPGGARADDGTAGHRHRPAHAPGSTRAAPRPARSAAAAPSRPPPTQLRPAAQAARQPMAELDDLTLPVAASRYGALVVLGVLALVAALALGYLVRHAGVGTAGHVPGTAAPYRLLSPSAPQPAPADAAGPSLPTVSTMSTVSPATPIELPKDETRESPAASGTPPPSHPRP